jgi:hypothetical protein
LLHNNVPVAEAASIEFPQLFVTVTTGADGVVFGALMPEPGKLAHPLTVAVTVYVAAAVTVMVAVVAPVLHKRLPVAFVDKVEVPLQLFTTVTTGVAGIAFGAAIPLPALLLQPFTVVVTV